MTDYARRFVLAGLLACWLPWTAFAASLEDGFIEGQRLAQEGKLKLAAEAYDQVLAQNPRFGPAYLARGRTYLILKKYAKSADDLNNALALGLINPETYRLRCKAYLALKENEKALIDADSAIAMDSHESENFYLRAQVLSALDQLARGLEDCNKAIKLDDKSAEAYCLRAKLSLQLEQYERGIADSNKALQLNPQLKEASLILKEAQKAEHQEKTSSQDQGKK